MKLSAIEEMCKSFIEDMNSVKVLKNKLLDIESQKQSFSFFNKDRKKQFKEQEDEIIRSITVLEDNIKEKENYLNSICKVNFDDAMSFISQVLSLIEGEKYKFEYFTFRKYVWRPAPGKLGLTRKRESDYVCMISTNDIVDLVSENYSNIQSPRRDAVVEFVNSHGGKGYLLTHAPTYLLFDYQNCCIPDILAKEFPYLSIIIVDFINLIISKPKESFKTVAAMMLESIPERYPDLINNKSKKTK